MRDHLRIARQGRPQKVEGSLRMYLGGADRIDPAALYEEVRSRLSLSDDIREKFEREPSTTGWRNEPWFTPIVGSGPLGLPLNFLQARDVIPDVIWAALDSHPEANSTSFDQLRGLGQDPQRLVDAYLRNLIQAKLGPRDSTIPPARPADLDPESGRADMRLVEIAAQLILMSALLTRTFHRISLDSIRPLGRWGSSMAELKGGAHPHNQLGDLRREFVEPVVLAADATSQLIESADSALLRDVPDVSEVLGFVRGLLEDIVKDLDTELPTLAVLQLTQLTEATWLILVRTLAGAAYPGWTDLLLRLIIGDNANENVKVHARPRWDQMSKLTKRVAEIHDMASHFEGSGTSTADRDANRAFYDSLADILWAQQDAKAAMQKHNATPLQPMAFVTSFDCELEMALMRTGPGRSFSVVLPVVSVASSSDPHGRFAWAQATIQCPTSAERQGTPHPGLPQALREPTGEWRGLGSKMTAGDWPNHPVVVRLTGCPMITLPKLEDNDTSRICSDLELNKGQQPHELHHVVSIDESIALLQTSADLEWARSADQSRGMPGEWFTAAAGPAPRRIWCLLGVPYQDPAVRNRVLSVLTRPEPLPAEVAQETAEPASESEDTPASSDRWKSAQVASDEIEEGLSFGDGEPWDAPTVRVVAPSTPSRPAEAPVNTSPRINRGAATPDRGTFRGFAAVGSRIDDQDIKLLDDLRIDVIKCRAEELTRPFTAYAEFVREFTSHYNDAVSAALSGATNGTGQR